MTQKTVSGKVTLFFYNIEDRLERVEDGSGNVIATYGYDPFGRRLWKDVGGVKTYYLYSDEGLIGEYTDTGSEIKAYGWKPGSTWGTDPLFMKVGSDYYFYHNDHLGTPQKMTAVNGAVVWSAKYGSFGEAFVDVASTVENNLRFPGQYYDAETGLYYNWHRYYDPKTENYHSVDPKGLNGGDINLYSYVWQNPVNFIDPEGLMGTRPNLPKIPDNKDDWTKLIKDLKKKGIPIKDCTGLEDACWEDCQKCCQSVSKLINPVGLWHTWYVACTINLCGE